MSAGTLAVDGLPICLRLCLAQLPARTAIIPSLHRHGLETPSRRFHSTDSGRESSTANDEAPTIPSRPQFRVRRLGLRGQGGENITPAHWAWPPAKDWSALRNLTPRPMHLRLMTDSELDIQLQDSVIGHVNYLGVMYIMRELIRNRAVKPALRHYKVAILANTEPLRGSSVQVQKLLEEMEEHGLVADSGILHAALKVLAIHPDYLLRQEILQTMRERWIPLSPAGWHNVVTGYIRERQYEMALKTLSHMESQGVAVQDWLYSLIIYNLCDAEEFAEALRLMRARLSGGSELSPNLWLHALDVASAALNEEMASFVWKRRVETRIINPSYGVCNNVLTIACRTGNTDLATSVFKVIGDRGGSFTQNDYEALIDTYAAAGYTKAAFTVLCVMHKTVGATKTATPALLSHLMWCEAEPAEAWEIVKQLHQEEKRDIPMAAPNVIFQLCERRSRPEAALQIYKELHLVCKPPFPVETFNYLLMVARRTKDLEMASYLMEEMRRQTVFADQTTYTTIIVLCAEIGRFADARNFVVEMTEAGMGLDDGYRRKLVEICSRSSDDPDAQALAHDASVRKPVSRHIDPRKFQARSSLESGKGSKEVVGEAAASAEARTEAA